MIEAYAAEGAEHGAGGAGSLPNPMHQFEIKRLIPLELFGFDASFTNSALFMVIAGSIITLFTVYAMHSRALVPSPLKSATAKSFTCVPAATTAWGTKKGCVSPAAPAVETPSRPTVAKRGARRRSFMKI